jgi:hypothetical protein
VHLELSTKQYCIKFNELLNSYDLKQIVDMPTHWAGGTFDLIITQRSELIIFDGVSELYESDHYPVSGHISVLSRSLSTTHSGTVMRRNWRNFDVTAFQATLSTTQVVVDLDWQNHHHWMCYVMSTLKYLAPLWISLLLLSLLNRGVLEHLHGLM